MFAELEVAVKEVGTLDLHDLTEDELAEAAVEIMRLRSALEAGEAAILAACDRRRLWAAEGARSASAWLAHETRHSKADCGARLRLGRTMAQMPLAAEAWAAGEISASHLRYLTRARNHRTAAAFAQGEAELVHAATTMAFEGFTQVVDYWLLRADPDGADESDMERAERRRVSLNETIGGMHSGSILLDPVSGVIVSGELGRLEKKLFDSDWTEAKQRLGRDPLVSELSRTSDQRRADALVEMARRSAGADGTTPARPLFSLVLGNSALGHLCELENGRVVSPGSLRRWFDDAEIERILFEGEAGRVIDVSRRRNFTGALRRLIQVRDRVCYHRSCDEPGSRCEVDHVIPWAAGGMTEQSNGRLACGFHNRLRNQRPPPP